MKFLNRGPHTTPGAIVQPVKQFGGEPSLLRAAISASYFLAPEKVSHECKYPNYARHSRALYPKLSKGDV